MCCYIYKSSGTLLVVILVEYLALKRQTKQMESEREQLLLKVESSSDVSSLSIVNHLIMSIGLFVDISAERKDEGAGEDPVQV